MITTDQMRSIRYALKQGLLVRHEEDLGVVWRHRDQQGLYWLVNFKESILFERIYLSSLN